MQILVILVMGVAGSGKTTIGEQLAAALSWQLADADRFHPPANIDKMRQGIALTDADRTPWLDALQAAIANWLQTQTPTVLACSALKGEYRQRLCQNSDQVKLVYLQGSYELIQQRLSQRQGHYMPAKLLQSQFETLEEPLDAVIVDIAQSPEVIVAAIRKRLNI